jgi:hypothetical protein
MKIKAERIHALKTSGWETGQQQANTAAAAKPALA